MTDGRKALEVVDSVEAAALPVIPRRQAAGAASRLGRGWAWFAGLAGPLVVAFCVAVEPAPADPSAPEPWWASIVFMALMTAMAGAAAEAFSRRPSALKWAAAAAGIAVALSITCPASGHHAGIGLWWFGQLAVSGGALALSLWGVRRAG